MTLGSLFDGSGGFPLAGIMHGIEPVWASEIEPFPIRVTKNRFPNMKHLGSVTDINGAEIEPVDIITFGSPCQDLSVAGKQAGIHEGQRSSLFFEAIRIIKEMRDHDRTIGRAAHDVRPRFAVWENVPGAFSSNKGRDFQAVLQALCEIEGKDVSVPMPPKGKWNPAGCVVGNGWSLAWRIYDAQFWGVPQRRKRIYLIADFGSERAGEILFEPESVRGDSAESGETGQGTAADAERSAGRGDRVKCLTPWDCESKRQYEVGGVYRTLDAGHGAGGQAHGICYALDALSSNSMKSTNPHSGFHEETVTKTLDTKPDPTCSQGGNVIVQIAECYAVEGNTVDRDSKKNGRGYCEGIAPTLNTQDRHAVTYVIEGNGQRESHQGDGYAESDTMYTLNATEHHAVAYGIDQQGGKGMAGYGENVSPALCSDSHGTPHAVCFQQNQREEVRDMGEQAGALSAEPGSHQQNYVCYPDKARSLCARADSSPFVDRGQNIVCYSPNGNHCGAFYETDKAATLETKYHYGSGGDAAMVVHPIDQHQQDARFKLLEENSATPTLSAKMGTGGNNTPMILAFEPGQAKRDGNECRFTENKVGTLRANMGDNQPAVCIERKVDE